MLLILDADVWSYSWLDAANLPNEKRKQKLSMHNKAATCGVIDVLVAPKDNLNLLQFLEKENVEVNVSIYNTKSEMPHRFKKIIKFYSLL